MARRFRIAQVVKDPDGSDSALVNDFQLDCNRESRLSRLTDDFLIEAKEMVWLRDAEGIWIKGPLGHTDVVIGQWDRGPEDLWDVPGAQPGMLTVFRIIPRAEVENLRAAGMKKFDG